MTDNMQTSRDFYRHVSTGDIFAIERRWGGELVGSAGPLVEGQLWPLAEYEYTPGKNLWLQEVSGKVILNDKEEFLYQVHVQSFLFLVVVKICEICGQFSY